AAVATPAPAAPAAKSLLSTLLPVLLVVVLAPAVSWLVMQYVMLPQLEKRLGVSSSAATVAAPAPAAPAPAAEKGKGKKGETAVTAAPNTYEFTNVIVNLAGTMGTRYLKTAFLVTGSDQTLHETFASAQNRPKLVDVTLNVLSSLTLAEIEEAGAKNIIREKLVNAYNQALGHKVVEQIYFSDFVVQ
ncbi:MAG TPA: flagellar basal body-associated FliL family protein, partial [Opitutaceae bacterium]|nr:flagellar basal body-associated FliL family protein [Opitutaceae bacterium]